MNFLEAIRERFGDDEEANDTLRDIARHGADAGWPGLTWYTDTTKLYQEHADEIWEALYEDAQDLHLGDGPTNVIKLISNFGGATNVGSAVQFENLLVWYMAERVARAYDE